ncbi:hypothetical protein Adt_11929 [Abeliophyllum distichum]|uniref:Uncharacterized protein n=1 Tax=Abeliophyllum distichum TaxID=126358 RepID=A0ABD1UPA0_9LAMI
MAEALSHKRIAESARKRGKEQVVATDKSIASINHDFDVMVTEKNRQLAKARNELEKLKEDLVTTGDSVVEAEAKDVRLYKINFPITLYGGRKDQLTKKIHRDLSFLPSTLAKTSNPEASAAAKASPHGEGPLFPFL